MTEAMTELREGTHPGRYDLIVIGAGPGGYPAALKAAALGKRVAVVEKAELGGTCLNRGCIPTKTLLHTTGLYRKVRHSSQAGLEASGLQINAEELMKQKDHVIMTLRDGIAGQFKKSHIDWYQGCGVITGEHLVEVGDSLLEGTYILIATGSAPARPPIPGAMLPGVTDSDGILEQLDVSCSHLLIIGGGVIGMEFAQVYSDIGCHVTVLEAMDRILPGMDKEIAQNLKMISKKRGVDIYTGAMVKEIKEADGKLICTYEAKGILSEAVGDKLLIATGRKPVTEGLFGQNMAGRLALNRGYIPVDEHYRTDIPGIYAIGDCIGGIQLAHVATAEGICAVEDMFYVSPSLDMKVVPSCVYTDPEIAIVGISADEAKSRGIDAVTGKYMMSVNGKSLLSGQERGFIKLVAEKETGRLLGAQLMCARATDMLGELELAISKGLTVKDLSEIIMPHPTFSEGIGEAAASVTE